jgi:hypothetical protein
VSVLDTALNLLRSRALPLASDDAITSANLQR